MRLLTRLSSDIPASEAGGKAAGLRALGAAGFRIPDCRVITVKHARLLFRASRKKTFLSSDLAAGLRAEAAALWPGQGLIARSSARLEDRSGASASGIYSSFAARDAKFLPKAVLSCLASAQGARARAYGRASGKAPGELSEMAVLVHPYLSAEFGGVCSVYHESRAVIEISRLGPEGVTSGKRVEWRGFYDFKLKKWSGPADNPRVKKIMFQALSTALRAQRDVVKRRNIALEFISGAGGLTVLQARPVSDLDFSGGLMDMPRVYLKISRLMSSLGLAGKDWSLYETSDLLAFNYLGARRPAAESLEHFCIMLRGGGIRLARSKAWVGVRFGGELEDVFPPPGDKRCRRLLSEAAKEKLLFIFRLADKSAGPVKRARFKSGPVSFPISFTVPKPRFGRREGLFLRLRLNADSARRMLERLGEEAENLARIIPGLRGGGYEKLLKQALKDRLKVMAKERKAALAAFSSKARPGAVEGLPLFPADGFVAGPLVFDRDILKTRLKRFIYAAPDFEPSFVSYARRISAVVVSRGAMCSHAAALCAEFKIPLVVEARNLGQLATGDRVSVNLRTGRVVKA
ncbi:MAG: hypothetical protein COX65_06675 [Elusimicrobia bacterium CG_4_10_14_0_2_um_filter_56_8]|nr:MAG: hypothetical protein AUJ51_07110 [Elusimicrobia bacterium CG1_02_56_21]PJA13724.1 MAG: hypothetical protein COX65_06675 [Elusimicrobia bacterium CG_4_10_14_0_2_um_filter_56_8]